MTLVNADTGEVVSEDEYLEALASRVRSEYRRSREAMGEAVDAYFAIGQCLLEAREQLRADKAFGDWLRAQEFPFNKRWALVLRTAAQYEEEVRSQLRTSDSPNIDKAVKQVTAAMGSGRDDRPPLHVVRTGDDHPADAPTPTEYPTIVIDPPWQYGNTATRGAAEDHYPTMSQDELLALMLPSADNAHLYLWVTNSFVREGFDLMAAWGFEYKTMLTWIKPQMGMGNYFRGSTEHVLFGIKGTLPTQRNDVMTWFKADRTRHSAKPESFYDLVESCSPGPHLEMFARRRRMGWFTWGNEA